MWKKNWGYPVLFVYEGITKCYEALYDTISYSKLKNPWNVICYNPEGKSNAPVLPQNDIRNSKDQKFLTGLDCTKSNAPWIRLKHISRKDDVEKFFYIKKWKIYSECAHSVPKLCHRHLQNKMSKFVPENLWKNF